VLKKLRGSFKGWSLSHPSSQGVHLSFAVARHLSVAFKDTLFDGLLISCDSFFSAVRIVVDSEVSVVFQVSAVDLSVRNRDGVVGIGTRLQAGQLGIGIPTGARNFSFRQKVHTASGDGFLLCWYRRFFPVCSSGGGMMLTTDLYLAQMLRMPSQHGHEQFYLFAFRDAAVQRLCFNCMGSFRTGNVNGGGSETFVG